MTRYHHSSAVPERFLRQLWKQQYFDTKELRTIDRRPVEVLSPGIHNTDGGPDFRNARIRIDEILYTGDVELHQNFTDWVAHEHDRDPKYNSVILHVVFRNTPPMVEPFTASSRRIFVLVLEGYLRASYADVWNAMILGERAERLSTIACSPWNGSVATPVIDSWLSTLAVQRFELKVLKYEERLKELVAEEKQRVTEPPPEYDEVPFGLNPGELPPPVSSYTARDYRNPEYWEQLLYEGFMEALGFAKNQTPFLTLARALRLKMLAEFQQHILNFDSELPLEAALFGTAGLLGCRQGTDNESNDHSDLLCTFWRQFRPLYRGEILHETAWQFFRLRPENFPSVRLAGAARLVRRMLGENLLPTIIHTIKHREHPERTMAGALEKLFTVDADAYWRSHYRLGEPSERAVERLVGRGRAREIILNVVVPVSMLYARIFREREVRRGITLLLDQFPSMNDNAITRIMAAQLIRGRLPMDCAMRQQGLLQLYKFFCVEKRCAECKIGQLDPRISAELANVTSEKPSTQLLQM